MLTAGSVAAGAYFFPDETRSLGYMVKSEVGTILSEGGIPGLPSLYPSPTAIPALPPVSDSPVAPTSVPSVDTPATSVPPTPGPTAGPVTQIDGIVVSEDIQMDPHELPPFEDKYVLTVMQGCDSAVVTFSKTAYVSLSYSFNDLADLIEPGKRVLVSVIDPGASGVDSAGISRYDGISVLGYGDGGLPEGCTVGGAEYPVSSLQDLELLAQYDADPSGAGLERGTLWWAPHWYLIRDAIQVAMVSRDPGMFPLLQDKDALVSSIYDRIKDAATNCLAGDPTALSQASLAELMRIRLTLDYLDSPAHRNEIGRWMDEDSLDTRTEYGGVARLQGSELSFERIPTVCVTDCADNGYAFADGILLPKETAYLFHFHAIGSNNGEACPSYIEGNPPTGDVAIAQQYHADGLVISRQGPRSFAAVYYDGDRIFNLGVYDYEP